MYPILKGKKIRIENLDLWAKNNPSNIKIKFDYMNKTNANHIKTFEIKLSLWLTPLFPPRRCGFKLHCG
jgi:hypothetical protein